jgi:cold shock CspA family protein
LKRSLELTQQIIVSPLFSIEDLVRAYIASGSMASFRLSSRKFMQALLQGNYNAFQQDQNKFVLKVFAISPYLPTTPLLLLSILKVLFDKSGEEAGVGGYVSFEQINQYFVAMGISEPAMDHAISVLLKFRLIEPYDASDESITTTQRVAIAHSGRMHYELALTDSIFIGDLAFATPVRSTKLVDSIRGIRAAGKMGGEEWQKIQSDFIEYCFEQDAMYAKVPHDSIYDGQRQLRFDLKARWIENKDVSVDTSGDKAAGYSQHPAVVKWYNFERGYGFADAKLSQDVFFHRSNLIEAEIEVVKQGDVLICDIVPGPKGKLHISAIHSIQIGHDSKDRIANAPIVVQGKVEFYNTKRGYGFIKSDTVAEDVYVSSKLLEKDGLRALRSGDLVKAGVEHGRFGKGLIATSIEILDEQTITIA